MEEGIKAADGAGEAVCSQVEGIDECLNQETSRAAETRVVCQKVLEGRFLDLLSRDFDAGA